MSVSARCIAIGVVVFLSWVAAFTATVASHWSSLAYDAWWNPAWLTIPGNRVGRPLLDLLRSTLGHNNLYAPGTALCWILLIAAAVSLGTGAWLLCMLLSARWRRSAERV
jgi:hypothetical protein